MRQGETGQRIPAHPGVNSRKFQKDCRSILIHFIEVGGIGLPEELSESPRITFHLLFDWVDVALSGKE